MNLYAPVCLSVFVCVVLSGLLGIHYISRRYRRRRYMHKTHRRSLRTPSPKKKDTVYIYIWGLAVMIIFCFGFPYIRFRTKFMLREKAIEKSLKWRPIQSRRVGLYTYICIQKSTTTVQSSGSLGEWCEGIREGQFIYIYIYKKFKDVSCI